MEWYEELKAGDVVVCIANSNNFPSRKVGEEYEIISDFGTHHSRSENKLRYYGGKNKDDECSSKSYHEFAPLSSLNRMPPELQELEPPSELTF